MQEKTGKQLCALALAAVMCVSGIVGETVPAAAAGKKIRWIERFEDLPEETENQTVKVGTKKKELDLPKSLLAEVTYQDPDEDLEEDDEDGDVVASSSNLVKRSSVSKATDNKATDSDAAASKATDSDAELEDGSHLEKVFVNWEDLDSYDPDEPGIYEFQAELKGKRDVLADAELPVITVEIADPEELVTLAMEEPMEVSSWAEMQEALKTSGAITLTGDIEGDASARQDGYLEVPAGVQILLNLNGHTIDRNANKNGSLGLDNCIFRIYGTLEIDDDSDSEGMLTGAWAGEGAIQIKESGTLTLKSGKISDNMTGRGGVFVEEGGTFIMEGGEISDNQTKSNSAGQGAGVYLDGGSFTMNGGSIVRNTAVSSGAGIYASNGAKLEINGGEISDNTVTANTNGGGIALWGNSHLTMKDGLISGNRSPRPGAGVYIYDSHFEMEGGKISKNVCSSNDGGGVQIDSSDAKFEMNGGIISGNQAQDGAGVCLDGGIFIMTDGSIEKNQAKSWGGGIYASSKAKVEIEGGSICQNYAGTNGGGIWNTSNLRLEVSGTPKITDNTSSTDAKTDDVYNSWSAKFYVTGSLGEEAQIGFSGRQWAEGTVAAEGSGYQITAEDYQKFFENNSRGLALKENTIIYHDHRWTISSEDNVVKRTCEGCGEEQTLTVQAKSVEYMGTRADFELEYVGNDELKQMLTVSCDSKDIPTDAGTYTIEVIAYVDGNKQILSIPFEILPAPLQIKARQQIIKEGETISNTLEQMETDGLKGADAVKAVQLEADTQEVTTTGKVTVIPSAVEIKDANGRLVNENYDITYEPGRLVILPAEEDASEIIGAGSIAADYYVGDGAPRTTLTNLTAEFAKNLLTEEELRQVENGEHVLVYLDITNIDDTVSKAVRSLVEKAARGKNADMQVGMYLDLSLYKKIGYDSPVKLSSTKGNLLQVKMELLQKLIPAEGAERSFYMIRVHNQKAELIPALYDAENQSLTFETDRFSTYAIVYADAKNENPEPVNPTPVIPNTSSSRRDKDRSSRTGWWTGKGNGWILKPETTEWYYIENGALKKGWHYDTEDGRWYHLDETTGIMDTRWHQINGIWYYFNDVPTAQTWFMEGGEWHYQKATEAHHPYGSMYAGEMTPDGWKVKEDGSWDETAK